MMDPWRTVDVTGWEEAGEDARGRRAKKWVTAPGGSVWLRKEPRSSRPCEPAIEPLTLALARAVGIDAAEGYACFWTGEGAPHRGIAVRRFHDPALEALSHGYEELRRYFPEFNAENHANHQAMLARDALLKVEEEVGGASLVMPFARMLAFDAWIGNGDRHAGNWGVLRSAAGVPRLAPLYDPASCLGVELDDRHALLDRESRTDQVVARYMSRCPSGFGDGQALVNQAALVKEVRWWPEFAAGIGAWLARFRETMDTFERVLREVPSEWLPDERKELVLVLLVRRLGWLEDVAPHA